MYRLCRALSTCPVFTVAPERSVKESYFSKGVNGRYTLTTLLSGPSGIPNKLGLLPNLGSWLAGGHKDTSLNTQKGALHSSPTHKGLSGLIDHEPPLQISANNDWRPPGVFSKPFLPLMQTWAGNMLWG